MEVVIMWIIDAFVYANNYHRYSTDNLGKVEDCMEGRIRLLTAITPSYAHTYQSLCVTGRSADTPFHRFRSTSAKATYLNLPNNRTSTQEKGDVF